MSSAGISFGGLSSGLDTGAIIAALMAVERRPIAALEQKKTSLDRQKGLFGDLRGLLDDLQEAADALRRKTDFLQMAASSSHEDVLTARATGSATPGSHQVVVHALATAQINASLGSADKDADTYGAGTLFVTVDGVDHPVSFETGSLQGIADAINAADFDVAADVIDTGRSGSDRYQLALRSKVAGADGAFTLTLDSGGAALQDLVDEINGNQLSAAANAHVNVNGIDVYRPTNSIADAIAGVTLELTAADPATTVTVGVTTDAEATAKDVQAFVDAYNKVVDFVQAQNALGEDGQARNPLFGDSTLRSIRSTLRSIVGGAVDTGNPAASLLVQVGIRSDREGRLTFTQSEFEEALAADEAAVASLFAQEGTGIAGRVSERIDLYTDTVDGLLKARNDGFDRLIRDTQRRIEQAEGRLELFEENLQRRFANLESLLARLQGQGSSLAAFPTLTNRA